MLFDCQPKHHFQCKENEGQMREHLLLDSVSLTNTGIRQQKVLLVFKCTVKETPNDATNSINCTCKPCLGQS